MPKNTRYTGTSNRLLSIGPRVAELHTVVGKATVPIIVAEEPETEVEDTAPETEVETETEKPKPAIHKAPVRRRTTK